MTDDRSLERAARTWIEDGPTVAPDHVVETALARIESTRQERAFVGPWRNPFMNSAVKLAAAAVVAFAAIAGSVLLFGGGEGIGFGPSPTPSPTVAAPSLEPSPSPTPVADPFPFNPWEPTAYADWQTFASDIYNVRIGHPAGWTVTPAVRSWVLETDATNFRTDAADAFVSPDQTIRVTVWTVSVDAGTTLQEWVEAYCELSTRGCADLGGRLEPALREVRDQHLAGAIIEFENDVQAFMPSWGYDTDLQTAWTDPAPARGGEITVVAAWRPPRAFDSRELVDGFSLQLCVDCGAP